jgi:uncharacterized SAM-binding protein YcdF (DUF218 family)
MVRGLRGWRRCVAAGLGVLAVVVAAGIAAGTRVGFFLQAPEAAPAVLLTGLEGGDDRTRRHYLDWRAGYLVDEGVPRAALLFDEASTSSWDEAVNTLALMKHHGWKRVLIVSDPPHMRRLSWVWARLATSAGVQCRLVTSDPRWWNPARWWANKDSGVFVVTELIKLAYYRVAH